MDAQNLFFLAAGVYGLSGYGQEPRFISDLNHSSREYLSSRLNGTPTNRDLFHRFCQGLGVENKLRQVSLRSPDPTGYMLQTHGSRNPEASVDQIKRVLEEMEMGNVYQQLRSTWGRVEGGPPVDN